MRVYNTIKLPTEGFYKEKGSKFLAYAYPVDSMQAVRDIVSDLKKRYFDARHHCFAHIIGHEEQQKVRANDDGEPAHSAGDPILGQIRSLDLTNTLVVVVRYFGGTKLGVPGLIHAYKMAAIEALSRAEVITIEVKTNITLDYSYDLTSEVLRILNDFEVAIFNQKFTDSCTLSGKVIPERVRELSDKLGLLGLQLTIAED